MYYWNPLESQKWRSGLTSAVTRALSVLTSSPDFPTGPSGPLCPGGPYRKLHALSYAKRKQNIWQASRSWLSLPCVQGRQHLQVDLVVQPDPVWRKIEKQFEDLMKNIKKKSDNDKNKGNKKRSKKTYRWARRSRRSSCSSFSLKIKNKVWTVQSSRQ